MQNSNWDTIEPERTRLRQLVAAVERELTSLSETGSHGAVSATPSADPGKSGRRLRGAWDALVAGLALGSEPELRTCPSCRRDVLSIATRCRYCLKTSPAEPRRRSAA